jgi:hypothetical protein
MAIRLTFGERAGKRAIWEQPVADSGEVVHDDLRPEVTAVLDELHVLGMDLIVVLSLLVGEDEVEGDLIGLVDDGAVAADHLAHVELEHPRDVLEVLIAPGEEQVRSLRVGGIGPEDDDV